MHMNPLELLESNKRKILMCDLFSLASRQDVTGTRLFEDNSPQMHQHCAGSNRVPASSRRHVGLASDGLKSSTVSVRSVGNRADVKGTLERATLGCRIGLDALLLVRAERVLATVREGAAELVQPKRGDRR
jgi:hypothetical protein